MTRRGTVLIFAVFALATAAVRAEEWPGWRGPRGDGTSPERQVRIACRDFFRRSGVLEKIIPAIDEILKAGGLEPPQEAPEASEPAIPKEDPSGDDGHRS